MAALPLDDYLAFTTREQLAGCVGKQAIAWVERTRGAVNIFVSSDNHNPFAITNNTGDDGIDISGLLFTSSCQLVWTQGPIDAGNQLSRSTLPLPYVTMTADAFDQKEPRALAPHVAVTTSADGASVLVAVESAGSLAFCEFPIERPSNSLPSTASPCGTDAMLLATVRSGVLGDGGAMWSPDGQTLAFAIRRFDHGFIGLYRRGATRVRWMSPSLDTDAFPAWSASGERLAFVRYRAQSDRRGITGALHQGPLFSIMVADVGSPANRSMPPNGRTGARRSAREIFRDWTTGYPGTGGNGYGSRRMLWRGDEHVLFGCETSGFTHVLMAEADGDVGGGTASSVDLTPAACEVRDWSALSANDELYISSNCDDVDGLGVARIHISSGARAVVWPGAPLIPITTRTARRRPWGWTTGLPCALSRTLSLS